MSLCLVNILATTTSIILVDLCNTKMVTNFKILVFYFCFTIKIVVSRKNKKWKFPFRGGAWRSRLLSSFRPEMQRNFSKNCYYFHSSGGRKWKFPFIYLFYFSTLWTPYWEVTSPVFVKCNWKPPAGRVVHVVHVHDLWLAALW